MIHIKHFFQKFGYIIIPILLAFLVTRFLFQITLVIGSSMQPNFENGQQLIIAKSPIVRTIDRYDVVISRYDDSSKYLIKRVIGLPGETIQIKDGYIYINDELLDESYGLETINDPGIASEPITLGEDEYFIMGDNRNNSMDSRYETVGPVTRSQIIGKVILRFSPFATY